MENNQGQDGRSVYILGHGNQVTVSDKMESSFKLNGIYFLPSRTPVEKYFVTILYCIE